MKPIYKNTSIILKKEQALINSGNLLGGKKYNSDP